MHFTYNDFEKILNRELNREEKLLIKKAYKLGKVHAFDVPKKQKLCHK